MYRYFEGKSHALLYKKYRPIPLTDLIKRIISFLKEGYNGPLKTAYDIGCGSGQSTAFFAPYFQSVVGTDISENMISQAVSNNSLKNVSYRLSSAENIPCDSNSVQLISASQAAHWFDLNKFYEDSHRVLSPGGVLALFGYEFPKLRIASSGNSNTVLNEQLKTFWTEFNSVDLKNCWAEQRKIVDERYKDFVIPFQDFTRDDSFYHESETSPEDIVNYVLTWSAYQKYCSIHGMEKGAELVQNLKNRLESILKQDKNTSSKLINHTSYFLLMARKSTNKST